MRICVFCSASEGLAPCFIHAARQTGTLIARRGHSLLYGGSAGGLMGALAQAAKEGGAVVEGVLPEAFLADGFLSPCCDRVIRTPDLRQRKQVMQERADAFLVLPGGIGTLDEVFDTTVLQSLGLLAKPLAFVNTEGCYDGLALLLDQMERQGFVSAQKRALYAFWPTPEQAILALEQPGAIPG